MNPPAAIDPWRAEQRLVLANRLADWRAAPGEPLLHGLALLALAGLLLPLAWSALHEHAATIHSMLPRWGWLALAALLLSTTFAQRRALGRRTTARERHWLDAQPIAEASAARNARWHAARLAALHVALVAAAALVWQLPSHWFGAALVAVLLAAGSVWWRPRPAASRPRSAPAWRDTPFVSQGPGRLWRWQLIEIGALFGPRRFAIILLSWLLVPAGTALLTMLASALALVLVVLALAAWQRSLAVLGLAQRWLACQPLRPALLLRRWAALPLLQLLLALAVTWLALIGLGAARLAPAVVIGAGLLGLLLMACVAAERWRPYRAGLQFSVQLALFAAVAQSLPPALLLLWPAQMLWLLWRSLRL